MVELSHAMRLLHQGNHRMIEVFISSSTPSTSSYQSREWKDLVSRLLNESGSKHSTTTTTNQQPEDLLFQSILTGRVFFEYLENVRGELSRVLRANEKAKVLYHSMRLLFHLQRQATT